MDLGWHNNRAGYVRRSAMRRGRVLYFGGAVLIAIAGYLITARTSLHAQQQRASVQVGANDIGGVVSSSKGPEAGVWVIAETTDLPTRYIKEVVTDDSGRYLIPDLPKAKYNRSEEHTSELQSPMYLVCRLLLEKKNEEEIDDY